MRAVAGGPGVLQRCVRLLSVLGLLLVATYYLIASVPFAYQQFLQVAHFWWMAPFVAVHPVLMLASVGAFAWTLRGRPGARVWGRYTLLVAGTTTVCMAALEWQPLVLTGALSTLLCVLTLALITALSAAVVATDAAPFERSLPPLVVGTTSVTAAAVAAVCAATYFLAAASGGAMQTLRPSEIVTAGLGSLAAHLGWFLLAALGAAGLDRLAARLRRPGRVRFLMIAGWAALVLAVLLRFSILSALPLGDASAVILAAAFALSVVAVATSWRCSSAVDERARSTRLLVNAGLAMLFVLLVPRVLVLADWGMTLHKLATFCAWAAVAGIVAALPRGRWRVAALACGIAAIGGAILAGTVNGGRTAAARLASSAPFDAQLAIERYATFDTSLSALLDVGRSVAGDRDFFTGLRQAGDRTDDRALPAVPLRLIDKAGPIAGRAPDVFVIVVDSLRPDYLSAYNPVVTFTPAIGRFAADSVVMRRAFTLYAGTALSEPALWAGGLIPRAMYPQPFSAMDNLERLLQLRDYRRYISGDEIVAEILDDWPHIVRLDARLSRLGRKEQEFKFDLCATLQELDDKLDHDAANGPVFSYSQSQNMHIRVLAKGEFARFDGLDVGGVAFFKPAVEMLERIDRCFGAFIEHLKATGRYDDSIVVLTSDHGDAYGEGGRWGHAFYVAPEIVRIPLIIHVPSALRAGRVIDTDAVSLLTDVTPTLYDLLGYPPTNRSPLTGRSFMPRSGQPAPPRSEPDFLIQSSYSRVFGLLDAEGRWMYTADGNRGQEQWFDLTGGDPYPKGLQRADRLLYRKRLLGWLDLVSRYYRP